MKGVIVLLDELARGVNNAASKMTNEKAFVISDLSMRLELRFARHVQPEVLGILGMHFRSEMVGTWRR